MRLGRLDRRLRLHRATDAGRDALNAPVTTWPGGPYFWAQLLTFRPTETGKAGQTAAQADATWRCRWSPTTASIMPRDRIITDGREYEVIGISEPVQRTVIEISAIARTQEQ